jgi:PAS domain S-box-containing protein
MRSAVDEGGAVEEGAGEALLERLGVGRWRLVGPFERLLPSAAWRRMHGLDGEGPLSRREYEALVVAEDDARIRPIVEEAVVRGEAFAASYRTTRRDAARHVEIRGAPVMRSGRSVAVDGVAIDVTARREAELEAARLRSVVEASDAFVGLADAEFRAVALNGGARRLIGLPDDVAPERTSVSDYFPDDLRGFVRDEVLPALAARGRWRGETEFRHFTTGERIPVLYDAFRIDGEDGRVLGYGTITRDIRETLAQRRALTERTVALESARERGELLIRELRHRVGNLLAVASSLVSISARDAPSAEALAAALRRRFDALRRAQGLALGEETVKPVALDALAAATLEPYVDGGAVEVEGPPVTVPAEPAATLALALGELASNAARHGAFTRPGGSISLRWRRDGALLRLEWRERGAASLKPPEREGTGLAVLRGCARTLGGQARIDWTGRGLAVDLALRIDGVS